MAITVPNQWTGTGSESDVQILTTPTTANWLIAVVSWRVTDGSVPLVTVGDLPRNLWTLLGTESNASGSHQIAVWACPHATYDGWECLNAYIACMQVQASDVGTVTCSVFEGAGLSDWLTVDSVTVGTASAATTFSVVMPGPAGSANCLMVGAAAIDNAAATVTVTSAGWTALTQVSRTGPDVKMAPTWRTSTATQTPAWSSSVAANWVGIAVAIKEVGTAVTQPNANYPLVRARIGLGYDVSTPLQQVTYTSVAAMHRATRTARGIQYELGDAQTEPSYMLFDDPQGSLAGRQIVSATANAAGTTTTIKVPDASATNLLFKGDFFQLYTSGGALKEKTVFQATALSSAAGTTTITFSPAAAVSTANTDVMTTTPLDVRTPYLVDALYGGKWYPFASGWCEQPTTTHDVEGNQQVAITCSDVWKVLNVASRTALEGELLRKNPTHLWKLDDPTGATAAANISGISTAQLVETPSKFGTGANGSADFGTSTQGFDAGSGLQSVLGDTGSAWRQTGLTSGEIATQGWALVANDTGFPSISSGVTVFGMNIQVLSDRSVITAGTLDPTLLILRNADPGNGVAQGSVIKISIDKTSVTYKVTVWDKSSHATTTTGSTGQPSASWLTWALAFDQTSWILYNGGSQVASGSANLVPVFTQLSVGGEADQFNTGRFWNAVHTDIAVYPRKLSATEISHLESLNFQGHYGGETIDSYMVRKLNSAGWQGARIIASSGLSVGTEPTDTNSIVGKLSTAAGYDDGLAFPDASGQIQYRPRLQSYHQTSRATLGELTASGEIPYQRGISFSPSPSYLYNLIRISNVLLTVASNAFVLASSTAVAADTASIRKYGGKTALPFDREVRLLSQADAFALACWFLSRFATPIRRVDKVTIDAASAAASAPGVWAFVLGAEVGDLVTVNRRPVGAPSTSQLYRVLRVENDQAAGKWLTTLTLGVAPATSLIVGDPVKGILGSNSMAA